MDGYNATMLYTIGISHETAPVNIREKVVFDSDVLPTALQQLYTYSEVQEAGIVSTCNRTEVYCHLSEDASPQIIIDWLHEQHQLDKGSLNGYFYTHKNEACIKHIIRVAAGLKSLIVGEPQILGQLKNAHQMALEVGVIHGRMDRLLQTAYRAAKEIRHKTAVGRQSVSVAYAATQLATQIFDDFKNRHALLVGAGATIELVARHLQSRGIASITIVNRTQQHAEKLASSLGAKAITFRELSSNLPKTDILVSSTSSAVPIIGKGAIETAIKHRHHEPIFLVDLAVPRDIEPEVADVRDAYLYTVDDLGGIIDSNKKNREQAAKEAEIIVEQHSNQFDQWLRIREISDQFAHIVTHGNFTKQTRLLEALKAIDRGNDPKQVLTILAHHLTNTLLHQPLNILRDAAISGDEQHIERISKYYAPNNNDKQLR